MKWSFHVAREGFSIAHILPASRRNGLFLFSWEGMIVLNIDLRQPMHHFREYLTSFSILSEVQLGSVIVE